MNARGAADFVGTNYWTLIYWLRSGLLHVPGAGQHGVGYEFGPADLMRAFTIQELKDQGANIRHIRAALRAMESFHGIEDWQHKWLAVAPSGLVVWLDDERQLVAPETGQVFMLDVAGLKARAKQAATSERRTVRQTRRTRAKTGA